MNQTKRQKQNKMHRNYKIIDKKVAHNSFSKRRVPVFPAFSETVQVYMDNNVKNICISISLYSWQQQLEKHNNNHPLQATTIMKKKN